MGFPQGKGNQRHILFCSHDSSCRHFSLSHHVCHSILSLPKEAAHVRINTRKPLPNKSGLEDMRLVEALCGPSVMKRDRAKGWLN